MQVEFHRAEQSASERPAGPRLFLNRWSAPLLLTAFSVFYFADALLRASEKYFWYDEIFTLYLSRLNSATLWKALQSGVDFNPPLFYWLTKIAEAVAGENRIGLRLPEIIGFWIFCLCLFRFVSRRAGILPGFIAMIFPLFTGAFYYAYEARPHGIVLGFAGLAIVCWQNAQDNKRRGLWLTLLSLCLFAAILNHCYALLILFPFAVAELLDSIRLRSWKLADWTSLALPALAAIPVYLPLLRAVHSAPEGTQFGRFGAGWFQVGEFYRFLLNPAFFVLLLALLFIFVLRIKGSFLPVLISETESVLALSFLFLPVLGVVAGKLESAPYYVRYFIASLIGVSFCLAIVFKGAKTHRALAWRLAFAAVLSSYLLFGVARLLWGRLHGAGAILFEPTSLLRLDTTPGNPIANESLLTSASQDLPIATKQNLRFLYVSYYAPPLGRRLYYVCANKADLPYTLLESFLPFGPPFNPPQVFSDFLKSHPRFYLYGGEEVIEQVSDLQQKGWQMRSLRTSEGQNLALVEYSGGTAERRSANQAHSN